MDNNYFKPDYHQLNRKAERVNGNNGQGRDLLQRFFPVTRREGFPQQEPETLARLNDTISWIKKTIDWEQDLHSASYVAFDTETTGLDPYRGDEIISLGAVIIENQTILEKPYFCRLINPNRPVSKQSQKITGINNEMLEDKPDLIPVLNDFLDFCQSRILVAHNAPFDLAFINKRVAEAIGRRIVNPVIDTVLLTSSLFYSFGDYSLEGLAPRFNLDLEGRHTALADARIAATLFIKLLPILKERKITKLHHLATLFSDLDLTKGYPLIF